MTNEAEVKRIMQMNAHDLLYFVITNPEYLTDPYYRVFGNAVRARYEELR